MFKKGLSLILTLILTFGMLTALPAQAAAVDTSVAAAAEDHGLASSCRDGNILHCFNWTLSQIKAELPNIAAAGFTSVQTSPLQPHDGSSHWYWLYQPTKFTVGNELGSYSDLQSLCTEAHKYGVKIIVDVVANHVAGSDNGNLANAVDSVFKNNKSTYFHNLGARGNADDRYSTTQKNIGMPDLNSENTAIQNMVYNMLVSLKNAGVDGVRWDAAKHIALPSENCAFWSKMAQIDLYQYGEILGSPADGATATQNSAWINEYAQYIGVSDTVYSAALMSAVRDGTTYKTTGNWNKKGVDSGKIVNWAESHDSYANEVNYGGWTKNLSQNTVDKAFALLAARADSQTLYLSRPFQTAHQSINYGVKGSTHFTSSEITAVNRFHNAMIGKDEKVLGSSTYYAVLRTGGAVIVPKTNDTDVSVNNTNTMVPVGTYTDRVSGSTFTVTEKTITGHVGSTGIAVIYNTPSSHTHTPSPAVQENLINASCTKAGSYDEVVYCSECGEEISRTPKTISAPGHSSITVSGKPATYFHTGLTDGEKCTVCNEWITPQTTIPVLKGSGIFCDVDSDGVVSAADAAFVQRSEAKMELPFTMDKAKADADDDGALTLVDASYIQLWLASLPSNDNIGKSLG